MKDNIKIYTDEKKNSYIKQFAEESQILQSELSKKIIGIYGAVDEDIVKNIQKKNKLPRPQFSKQWVRCFMKRNGLSWRHTHYSRYGIVD